MIGILLLIIALILAFVAGIVLWKVLGPADKFDYQVHKQIVEGVAAKKDLETQLSLAMRNLRSKRTLDALKEDLGPVEFNKLMGR